jgi:hypothetical protein
VQVAVVVVWGAGGLGEGEGVGGGIIFNSSFRKSFSSYSITCYLRRSSNYINKRGIYWDFLFFMHCYICRPSDVGG